jgi:hypothetical protein
MLAHLQEMYRAPIGADKLDPNFPEMLIGVRGRSTLIQTTRRFF